jgi:hypothetical protein
MDEVYVLVYDYMNWPDAGGGIHFEEYKSKWEMLTGINNARASYGKDFVFLFAGRVDEAYNLKQIEATGECILENA